MLKTAPPGPSIPVSPSSRNLAELLRRRCEASGPHPCAYEKDRAGGEWRCTTWSDFYQRAAEIARGLVDYGVEIGDRVAILGPTRVAWGIYDMAAQVVGAISIGIYPMQTVPQVQYLLKHSGAKVIFVDGREELEAVLAAASDAPELVAIVPWTADLYQEYASHDPRIKDPAGFRGTPLAAAEITARGESRSGDDVALLIYTSGTTGSPKAAMISHGNILSILGAWNTISGFANDDIFLAFLPMAHAAERILSFYGGINAGIAAAYATRIATVLDEIREVQPTVFGSVPRIYEKAYARIYSELERKPPAIQALFRWAIAVGKERTRREHTGQPLPRLLRAQLAVADRLVHRRLRAAFGGRVRQMVTGAAPIDREILELFWAVGLPIYECYGMTEATVITHVNHPGATRLTSVGRPLPGLECRIASDGEVLLRAPWVFKGYYRDPEATDSTIIEGWLHSGDIGEIDSDGYLYIKDRKKHLIITAGGKNLAPANIERALRAQDPLISQVHVHGDRRPYIAAVIAPSPLEVLEFARDRGLLSNQEVDARLVELRENPAARSPELVAAMAEITRDPAIHRRIREAVGRGNRQLSHVEQVRRFIIFGRDFSQEEGELTPTMKVKRSTLESKLRETLDRIYDEPGFALEPL